MTVHEMTLTRHVLLSGKILERSFQSPSSELVNKLTIIAFLYHYTL